MTPEIAETVVASALKKIECYDRGNPSDYINATVIALAEASEYLDMLREFAELLAEEARGG